MEELIKKHLGINTPQWVIDNCKRLIEEWDEKKAFNAPLCTDYFKYCPNRICTFKDGGCEFKKTEK